MTLGGATGQIVVLPFLGTTMKPAFIAILLACIGTTASAQTSPYITTRFHIDVTRQPKDLSDGVRECADSTACAAAVEAIGNYYGIPAGEMLQAAATFSRNIQGEGTYVFTKLPSNYTYCRASVGNVSITPHDGPRGSLFMGQSRPDGLYYETWTPVQGYGGGTSWVETDVTLIGVRTDLADQARATGKCGTPMRVLWYCRGGGCGPREDRGQSLDASSPPGANSAK